MTTEISQTSDQLSRLLASKPDEAYNWHQLGLAYAREGLTEELLDLCDQAAPKFGNHIRFFQNLAIDLSERQEWSVFETLARGIPQERLEWPIIIYYLGCQQIVAERYVDALDFFHKFKKSVLPRHRAYPLKDDANLNTLFRQGTLPERLEETKMILKNSDAKIPKPEIMQSYQRVDDSSYVVAISADKRYFLRFADELFKGYADLGVREPIHFHLIAPNVACYDLFERLSKEHPTLNLGWSSEPEETWHNPVYYTCARFSVVEQLLDTYKKTILFLDADSLPAIHPAHFLTELEDIHFACVKTKRNEPASVNQAGVMVFPDTAKTRSFANNIFRFTMSKLALPPVLAWMLDQAALISVLTLLFETDPHFRFANLINKAQCGKTGHLITLAGQQEKGELMNTMP